MALIVNNNIAKGQNQSHVDNAKSAIDKIPDKSNIWIKIGKSALKGAIEGMKALGERRQQESITSGYEAEYQQLMMKAKLQHQATISATSQMYDTYQNGAHQAMMQGLADGQQMANARAQMASSGVRVDSGSKKEIQQSNELASQINQNTIQVNTVSQAMQYADQATMSMLEEANYQAQATIAWGNAQASNVMAKSISPLEEGLIEFQTSLINSFSSGFGGSSNSTSSSSSSGSSAFNGGFSKGYKVDFSSGFGGIGV